MILFDAIWEKVNQKIFSQMMLKDGDESHGTK